MRTARTLKTFALAMLALGLISAGIEETMCRKGKCSKTEVAVVLKEAVKKVKRVPLFESLAMGSFIQQKSKISS